MVKLAHWKWPVWLRAQVVERPADVVVGSWSCKNALGGDARIRNFLAPHYALMAAMSGWIPMMFITRVRL
jgi:hypothetical protein